ncbi:peptidase C39 family protein [Streptomyces polyrhachis]|uniref:Peptidase C39 family protein n=1 Tax=Streptomyces polyrhachis TaxID=1282885 RepID=A0ABW2GNM7_9ACTN
MPSAPSRRTVLAAALAAAAGAAVPPAAAPAFASARTTGPATPSHVDYRGFSSAADWAAGTAAGTAAAAGTRAGIEIAAPAGSLDYTDPHTQVTAAYEYATWTSPVHTLTVPATEVVPSWNAATPAGTWIQVELRGTYNDGSATPWFTMGRWAGGDADIKRTSLDGQGDGRSSVWTDTLAVDDAATGLRLASYQLRLTLHRRAGSGATPTVWRVGAMGSDVPDRFEVPATTAGVARELLVPRYSQTIHQGDYKEYDGGGEAWCSPSSTEMIVEYWGRGPTAEDLAWVDLQKKKKHQDPQVDHAARFTFDYQYSGCGNWPFNTAYAATYREMNGVVTRLNSLTEAEALVGAGIPLITSQSFTESELTGAGYGTSGHLMTVIGFTAEGDVIANDPANSPTDADVRKVYRRREWENIWLRTKRYNDKGEVRSGTGGICYVLWGSEISAGQREALASVGIV